MKLLFVFDRHLKVEAIPHLFENHKVHNIDLFSLTADQTILKRVKDTAISKDVYRVCELNSANAIDQEVQYLKKGICEWSANLGESKVGVKKIKEWFLLPGCKVSTWWFSLLSEKNTLITDAFFQIAQGRAIHKLLATGQYDSCFIALSDRNLRQSIEQAAQLLNIHTRLVSVRSQGLKSRTKYLLNRFEIVGDFLRGLFTWIQFAKRCHFVRQRLGPRRKRLSDSKSLLFVSYFPVVDKEAAEKGVFRNKYALALQNKLEELGISIVWILMPVKLDAYNFKNAVYMARNFANRGETVFVFEEFLTVKNLIRSLILWMRQILLSSYLLAFVNKNCLLSELVGEPCKPIIKRLWNTSFRGHVGMQGILYYFIYRKIFENITKIDDCLYYCEMFAWEKALNAAKKSVNPGIRTIGFQHTSVSKNYFHYFYDKRETERNGRDSDLPLPDVLACNGEITCSILKDSGYSGVKEVEAVRHIYLDKVLSLPIQSRGQKPVLLVAGSIDQGESRMLISIVNAAFPKAEEMDIWFKGHPLMPFEKLFSGIDISNTGYRIRHEDISELLESVWAVLVPSSTLAIEALAFGCEVIVPVFPDSMFMSPLVGFEEYYHKVTCTEELIRIMEKIVDGYSLHDVDEYRKFVRKYWHIDGTLTRWTKLLLSNK